MQKSKYKRGDLVRIDTKLGPPVSLVEADQDAIVLEILDTRFWKGNEQDYLLLLCESGIRIAWYNEWQLSLIRYVGEEEIKQVLADRARRETLEGNLEWIVTKWPSIRVKPPAATMCELMRRIGITDPWGARSEGYTYYMNAHETYKLLDPVLQTADLLKVNGFIECYNAQKERQTTQMLAPSTHSSFLKALANMAHNEDFQCIIIGNPSPPGCEASQPIVPSTAPPQSSPAWPSAEAPGASPPAKPGEREVSQPVIPPVQRLKPIPDSPVPFDSEDTPSSGLRSGDDCSICGTFLPPDQLEWDSEKQALICRSCLAKKRKKAM